jgi:ferritin-like metal-binding protein YciE
MSHSDQKVAQYLDEAHASEIALVSVLRSQVAITPRGSYRDGLEKHVDETRDHARRIQERLGELEQRRNPLQAVVGFAETLFGQSLALGKAPFDLIRGTSGEEKVLKNAKDACAAEALEIATYTALERLAGEVGDEQTAKLAVSIRGDEKRMLERILRDIPRLTDAVLGADVKGESSYAPTTTGGADAARGVGREAKETARKAETSAKRTARQARKVPGVAQTEGQIKDLVASEKDLAIARYDSLTAEEIVSKLPELSQIEIAKIDAYERRHDNRQTVLSRISTLRRAEPWPGYDEMTVGEIEAVLCERNGPQAREVASYQRAHKNRAGALASAERAGALAR